MRHQAMIGKTYDVLVEGTSKKSDQLVVVRYQQVVVFDSTTLNRATSVCELTVCLGYLDWYGVEQA